MPPEGTAAPAAAITTDTVKGAGPAQAADKATATTTSGTVMVKPVAAYFCSATNQHRNAGDEAYPVEPSKAAELFSRRLVDYASADDETKAVEARVKAETATTRAARQR